MLDLYLSFYKLEKKYIYILNLKNLQQKSSSFTQDVKMGHKILFFSYGEDGFQYYTPTFEGHTQLELTFSRRAAPRCPQKTKKLKLKNPVSNHTVGMMRKRKYELSKSVKCVFISG